MRISSLILIGIFLLISACQTSPRNSSDKTVSDLPVEKSTTPLLVNSSEASIRATTTLAKPVYNDIWDRIRAGFILSREIDRKRVQVELDWFIKNPEYVERVTQRSIPHLYFIVDELEKNGIPLEIALLPIVESAYDPFAYSHSRAAGLWQFIPPTARLYGLNIDWWYDGRRDVRASTKAAIDYLTYLNDMFNTDWLLSLAAYNSGQGNVLSSIRKSKLHPDQIDFWSLKLLRETQSYVPRLLAISEIIANPERYEINLPEIPNQPYWQVVTISSQLDLSKAAALASIDQQRLYFLNPGYNQWATHPDGPHEILVPIDSVDRFKTSLDLLSPSERVAWHRHQIKPGESLSLIAKQHRTTVKSIKSINNLSADTIIAGDSLLIPSPTKKIEYTMTSSSRLNKQQKKLSRDYGLVPITHTVKAGDSLWELSLIYDVNIKKLAKWNGIGINSTIHPGNELIIFQENSSTITTSNMVSPRQREHVRKLNYRVRDGESLSLIAHKFNITVANIKSWNKGLSKRKYIHPGDHLTLYIDVTAQVN